MSSTSVVTRKSSHGAAARPASMRPLAWVFLLFWSFLALCNSGVDESEGTPHFSLAEHIVTAHSLSFDEKQSWGGFMPGPGGKYYCAHEIGNTLFALPTAVVTTTARVLLWRRLPDAMMRRLIGFIVSFQAGIYISITATLLYQLLRKTFALGGRHSLIACALLILTTPLLGYDRILYDGVLCGTLIMSGFFSLTRFKDTNKLSYLIVAFASFGFAVITRLPAVLAVAAASVYLLAMPAIGWRAKIKNVLLGGLALVPFALWQLYYDYLRTGSCFTPPILAINPYTSDPLACTFGLLASPGKGLLVYAPLLLLSCWALPSMRKRYPAELSFIAVLALSWIVLHGRLDAWSGCWCWGPRYCITIIPVLFVPVALALERIFIKGNLAVKCGAYALLLWGLVVNLSSILIDFGFRITYLEATHVSHRDLIWSWQHGQVADAVSCAGGNIMRLFTHAPIVTLKGTALPESAWPMAIQYCSSTINIWPNMMLQAGMRPLLVALAVLPLILLFCWSLRKVLAIVNSDDALEQASA